MANCQDFSLKGIISSFDRNGNLCMCTSFEIAETLAIDIQDVFHGPMATWDIYNRKQNRSFALKVIIVTSMMINPVYTDNST